MPAPTFHGGSNIALKIPRYKFAETLRFYQEVLRLPYLGQGGTSRVFQFGAVRLWLDCVDHQSQTDVWLELYTPDPGAALRHLEKNAGTAVRDEIEPLGDFKGHWISDPAGVVYLLAKEDQEQALTPEMAGEPDLKKEPS